MQTARMNPVIIAKIDMAVFRRRVAIERYPTRTVEHLLAWIILLWSAAAFAPGEIMTGPAFVYLLKLAPEYVWGGIGVVVSAARLVALFINGRWYRSPTLRLLGAASGLVWWMLVTGLYWAATRDGGFDFPMRWAIFALIGGEGYSCYRCGQDREAARLKEAADRAQTSNDGV